MPDHPLRLLFIVISTDIGGAERQAINLARGAIELGISVQFLSLSKGSGRLMQELPGTKVDFFELDPYPIHFFRKYPTGFSQLKLFLKAKKQFSSIEKIIRDFSPTAIIPFTYYPNLVSGIISKKLGLKKTIWNQRDLGTEGMDDNYFEKKAIRNTTTFIGNSKAVIDYLKTYVRTQNGSFSLIENSVCLPSARLAREEWRKQLGISNSEILFLMISNVHPNKDHETVIKAFELLKDEIPPYKVAFVGRKHTLHVTQLQQQIAGTFPQDKILFPGFSDDVNGLLQACDIFIFSSKTEGSPNALLEAMLAGKKIIASNIAPVTELLGENHAYLFGAGNAKELSEKLAETARQTDRGKIRYEGLEQRSVKNIAHKYLSAIQ